MGYDIMLGRDATDKKAFGERGRIHLGKGYVTMGQYTSLSNDIYLDVARSHVVLIAGKRGGGKSHSIGVMAEELASLPPETAHNIASLIFDTMGIFWTMKFKNEKDTALLREWNLKEKNLPVHILVPAGKTQHYKTLGIPVDKSFALNPSLLTAEDWINTFNLSMTEPIAILIQTLIPELADKKDNFSLGDIHKAISTQHESSTETKHAAQALFKAAESWGIFASDRERGTKIDDLITPGTTTVLDLSVYSSIGSFNVRALVISLISRALFRQRMEARKTEEMQAVTHGVEFGTYNAIREMPLVWMFIDEAHEFLPKTGKTPATDALVQILREGRQPGISLVLATQQPGQIHQDVMTQTDIVIAHRVTAKDDVQALNHMMQSYLQDSIQQAMDALPQLKGSAIILDDNSERMYPMRVRPRFTWHGGDAPVAIPVEKEL